MNPGSEEIIEHWLSGTHIVFKKPGTRHLERHGDRATL